MASDQEPDAKPDCRHRNLWQAIAAHWFEDLPGGQELTGWARWLTASAGSATFIVIHLLLTSPSVLGEPDLTVGAFLVICFGFSGGLGFLLAWKRKRTGPVRLYVSGIALPAFVFFVARFATFLGD